MYTCLEIDDEFSCLIVQHRRPQVQMYIFSTLSQALRHRVGDGPFDIEGFDAAEALPDLADS